MKVQIICTHYYCNPPETKFDHVCDLFMFIVGQRYTIVYVSLQAARLCDIGAGHTCPNINQRVRKQHQITSLRGNTCTLD